MRRAIRGRLIGLLLTLSQVASAQDDLARELPRIKPLEPAAAIGSFRIHPGFHLEQVAAEPMVINPVSACYDAGGRLYVVEMCGYPDPEKTPTGRVAGLEDRDERRLAALALLGMSGARRALEVLGGRTARRSPAGSGSARCAASPGSGERPRRRPAGCLALEGNEPRRPPRGGRVSVQPPQLARTPARRPGNDDHPRTFPLGSSVCLSSEVVFFP